MRDVAQAVGMSSMTVSRALKDDASVSAKTRARIQKVAGELGYVYDANAQAFRTQKSGFVGVTLPSIDNASFASTFRALSDGLDRTGLQILLGSTNYSVEKEAKLVRQLLARNPEAMVLTGGHHTQAARDLLAGQGVPVIETWDLPDQPLGHVVGFSNATVMDPLIKALVARGRRRFGFLGASAGADLRGAARRDGAIAIARSMGLPEMALIDAGPAPVSLRSGAKAAEQNLATLKSLDALLCVSDPLAFGAMQVCRQAGISVPEDLAITGFGNFELSAVSDPKITTIDVQPEKIGAHVAALLLDRAALVGSPIVQLIEPRLIDGETI